MNWYNDKAAEWKEIIETVARELNRTKNGFREGRPPINPDRKKHAAEMIIQQKMSYKEVEKLTGISKSTLIRAVKIYSSL